MGQPTSADPGKFSGIDGSADIGLELFRDRVPKPPDWLEFGMLLGLGTLPKNVPGPGMVFQGLRNLLGSWNISWKEFRCLGQHSKALGRLNATRPRSPFQKMSQVLGWCSKASGTCLGLGTFPGKSSDAYGRIPKPWAH